MRYAIVVEKTGDNYSAYAPDLPGCVVTGSSVKEAEQEILEAIKFHIDGLRDDGLPVPAPSSVIENFGNCRVIVQNKFEADPFS